MEYNKTEDALIHVYTHLDADGLSAGAILGKALYRLQVPFQITVLKQLEREEIIKIAAQLQKSEEFLIFSDFGSGQYKELKKRLSFNGKLKPFIILDHHLPQEINDKTQKEQLEKIYQETRPWHINPYFYGVDGSVEISGAGMSYLFAKTLNDQNIDLSQIALVGAIGDIQNQGPNKSFTGLNSQILKDAQKEGLIEIVNDLNFSSLKPLNQAIAYSNEIELPGLKNDENKTLKFLQTLGILMEDSEGNIKSLNNMTQDDKQKISSAIIEYATLKLDIEPSEIYKKLIVNKYLLSTEKEGSELQDSNEFSNLLNSCGRTNNASLGIAIAMGDRKKAYEAAKETLVSYKKSLMNSLNWIEEEKKLQELEYIQYFFGEETIPENIIGTIASMLVFDTSGKINHAKPIFGLAKREDEEVYKISARAHESIVNEGVNLSEAIREACNRMNLDVLGGGHPPAAGTKIPTHKAQEFLNEINIVIKKQLE